MTYDRLDYHKYTIKLELICSWRTKKWFLRGRDLLQLFGAGLRRRLLLLLVLLQADLLPELKEKVKLASNASSYLRDMLVML